MIKIEAQSRLSKSAVLTAAMSKGALIKLVDTAIQILEPGSLKDLEPPTPFRCIKKSSDGTIKLGIMLEVPEDLVSLLGTELFDEWLVITSGADAFKKYTKWAQQERDQAKRKATAILETRLTKLFDL